jgi:hypothetical protein
LPKTDKWVAGWVRVTSCAPVVADVRDSNLSRPSDLTAGLTARVSYLADAISTCHIHRMECYPISEITCKRILLLQMLKKMQYEKKFAIKPVRLFVSATLRKERTH